MFVHYFDTQAMCIQLMNGNIFKFKDGKNEIFYFQLFCLVGLMVRFIVPNTMVLLSYFQKIKAVIWSALKSLILIPIPGPNSLILIMVPIRIFPEKLAYLHRPFKVKHFLVVHDHRGPFCHREKFVLWCREHIENRNPLYNS